MDATKPVRQLLKDKGIHDYEKQPQGEENKVKIQGYIVGAEKLHKAKCSLYRPTTKKGDPRIWIYGLKRYSQPYNLLALLTVEKEVYLINLSDEAVAESFKSRGFAYQMDLRSVKKERDAVNELVAKIQALHDRGYIEAQVIGDTAVGDTLEHELGIKRNNKKTPDYKGIELKAKRRLSGKKPSGRVTLFCKVPDKGLKYRQIVEEYGQWGHNDEKDEDRFGIHHTMSALKPNSYGLMLEVDEADDKIHICHIDEEAKKRYLSYWNGATLRKRLAQKHKETFLVEASVQKDETGKESFQYNRIKHTKNLNVSLFLPLVEAGVITSDLLGHFSVGWKWRDHGLAHKIGINDWAMLFGEPVVYDLRDND